MAPKIPLLAGLLIPLAACAAAAVSAPSQYDLIPASERRADSGRPGSAGIHPPRTRCAEAGEKYIRVDTGPSGIGKALIGATGHDIFSIDPSTCRENWRIHEKFGLAENHGPANQRALWYEAAYLDGLLFLVSDDGQMLAYEFLTGRKVWARAIGRPRGERAPALPVVRGGLVFTGSPHSDTAGVKGRMYALDARTGDVVWEFLQVPAAAAGPGRGPLGATSMAYALDPSTGDLERRR
jgi:alcohol dehydrogenase (cytochrome c)